MSTAIRTTVALDEDVMILAQQTARRHRISLGRAISQLVREKQGASPLPEETPKLRSPYSLYPARSGELISSEHVYRLMDEEGI